MKGNSVFFVTFDVDPYVQWRTMGCAEPDHLLSDEFWHSWHGPRPQRVEVLTRDQWRIVGYSDEPSRAVAEMFGLPFQRFRDDLPPLTPNIVELIDDQVGSGFNQPCRFGRLVVDHAVYCHNTRWIDAPRKCGRTWYTGGETRDEDCPGFEPQPASGGSTP